MELTIYILELIGVVAASVSGATTAIRKSMDLFGVIVLGTVTAVGGGVLRDLILGRTPPIMFQNPIYAATAVIAAILMFIPAIEKLREKRQRLFDIIFLVMDSLGLGAFTVVGTMAAYTVFEKPSIFLAVFVGVTTGVGGGVLRDIMSMQIPNIFVKHFYAIPCIIGAIVYVFIWEMWSSVIAVYAGVLIIVSLRFAAAKFHWNVLRYKQK